MSTVGFQPETVDGGRMSEEAAERLHALKNRPDPPMINGAPMTFPPYRYQPYPRALYHATDPSSPRLVKDEGDERNLLSRGWADSPVTAEKAAEQHYDTTVAIPAAERAYDDRHMSAAAKAEIAAAEAAIDDHLVTVPVPKKRPGRPARQSDTPSAA